jgi:hypothetical protein
MNTTETVEKLKEALSILKQNQLEGWGMTSVDSHEIQRTISSALTLIEAGEKDRRETLENIRDMCLDAANGNWPHKEACKVISSTCTRKLAAIAAQQEAESV